MKPEVSGQVRVPSAWSPEWWLLKAHCVSTSAQGPSDLYVMRRSRGPSFIQLRPVPGPAHLRAPGPPQLLATPWHYHCPGTAQSQTCLALWLQPADVHSSSKAPTAHAVTGLDSRGPAGKSDCPAQADCHTGGTAGPQSLFLYFILGLHTPGLRPSQQAPAATGSCLEPAAPGAHLFPPPH